MLKMAPDATETPEQQPTPITTKEPSSAADSPAPAADDDPIAKAKERMDRFKALRARAKTSSESNLKAATHEAHRLAAPSAAQLSSINRKRDAASAKLMRADMEADGEDFERRRAWDWTVEESEAWDRRVRRKEAHRDNAAFSDFADEANKTYKRQLKNGIMTGDGSAARERYEKEKQAAIEKAAQSGGLELLEMEDGELIAVDRDGRFYSTADSTAFAQGGMGNKPDKQAVDRLVEDLKKAEEVRLRKRRERMGQGEDGDVTYINEKNKQFNMKLARFYNKYTSEVRDSFERGTMI